jgi:hypothetical protein
VNDFLLNRAQSDNDATFLARELSSEPAYKKALAASMNASNCNQLTFDKNKVKFLANHQPMMGEGTDFFGGTIRQTVAMVCDNDAVVGLKIQDRVTKNGEHHLMVKPLLVR